MENPLSTRALVLLELAHGPAFGLMLIERIGQRSDGALDVLEGCLYPILSSLTRQGLILCIPGEQAKGGGRRRRWYRLTAAGAERVAEIGRAILSMVPPGADVAAGQPQAPQRMSSKPRPVADLARRSS